MCAPSGRSLRGNEVRRTEQPWGALSTAGVSHGFLIGSHCAREAPGHGDFAVGVSDGNTHIPSASGLQERATLHGDGDVPLCLSLVLLSVTVPVSVCLYTRLSVSVSMSLSGSLCLERGAGQALWAADGHRYPAGWWGCVWILNRPFSLS